MPDFVLRLYSPSTIRLGTKAYDDDGSRRNLHLTLPHAEVAVFDSFRTVAPDVLMADGLLIQTKLAATDIEEAVHTAVGVVSHVTSVMSCIATSSISIPKPLWVYDATPSLNTRDFRFYFYDGTGPQPTRAINHDHVVHLLDRNYNSFLANPGIKDDFKDRIQRSMMAYRRGVSDNDDVLNEFLTAWSTMEGLDCVYRKLLPTSTVRDFKDGMKDVLIRLKEPAIFDMLEELRNGLAHGDVSLAQANQTAATNLELVRRALLMMIFRILGVNAATIDQIVGQTTYKGKFQPYVRLVARIQFAPVDVKDLAGQPRLNPWIEGQSYQKQDETLGYTPDIRFRLENIDRLDPVRLEFWGDTGAPIRMTGFGSTVIPNDQGAAGGRPSWE